MTTTLATRLAFTVDAPRLAAATAWVARHISARPQVAVLGGIRLDLADRELTISAFDYDVSATWRLDVNADPDCRASALVSGRLLAELVKTFPDKPVNVTADDAALSVVCASVKLTLPLMAVDEYPTLPTVADAIGVVDGEVLAAAAERVVPATVGAALAELTGVHATWAADGVRLIGTDAYRFALASIDWRPAGPNVDAVTLVPGAVLADVARAFADEPDVQVGATEGLISFTAGARTVVSRLLAAEQHRGADEIPAPSSREAPHDAECWRVHAPCLARRVRKALA